MMLRLLLILLFIPFPAWAKPLLPIQEIKTDTGITAWLVEDKTTPVISIEFGFRNAGSKWDTLEKQGTAQLLSNTLDEGAGDLDAKAFQKILADENITLQFSSSRDVFSGELKMLRPKKEQAFKLLGLALTQPRFDEDAIERMRAANISRIKSDISDPDWLAARLLLAETFGEHPYAKNAGGTISTLRSINANDLRAFKDTYLTQANLVIGASGNISATELKKLLESTFGALPLRTAKQKVEDHALKRYGVVLYTQDIPQTVIRMALPAISDEDPDYAKAEVFNHIFGAGGFGSKLTEEIREKSGLTYGIHSGFLHLDSANLLQIATSTENKNVGALYGLYNKVANDMKANPASPEVLQETKNYLTGSIPLQLTSTEKIANLLCRLQLSDKPQNYLDTYQAAINAVTAEDVRAMAHRLLHSEPLTILVGQPQGITVTKTVRNIPGVE